MTDLEKVITRIDRIVAITPDLNQEFKQQAANYSWLGSYFVQAKDRVRRLKNELDIVRADLTDMARKKFADQKVTKDVLEGWVLRCEAYQKALASVLDAQLAEDRLTVGIKALEFKRDSLMSLGANMRREIVETLREPVVKGSRR